ncbi:hypothetical protein D3C72_2531820 [compost metagenome]
MRQVRQQHPGQDEHDDRPQDPVEEQRGAEELALGREGSEGLIPDLGEHREHHPEQANGDG